MHLIKIFQVHMWHGCNFWHIKHSGTFLGIYFFLGNVKYTDFNSDSTLLSSFRLLIGDYSARQISLIQKGFPVLLSVNNCGLLFWEL